MKLFQEHAFRDLYWASVLSDILVSQHLITEVVGTMLIHTTWRAHQILATLQNLTCRELVSQHLVVFHFRPKPNVFDIPCETGLLGAEEKEKKDAFRTTVMDPTWSLVWFPTPAKWNGHNSYFYSPAPKTCRVWLPVNSIVHTVPRQQPQGFQTSESSCLPQAVWLLWSICKIDPCPRDVNPARWADSKT